MQNRDNMSFYRVEEEAVHSFVSCFDHFFRLYLPLLWDHFEAEVLTISPVSDHIFRIC